MSLAMYAAPFDNELNQINNKDIDTPIGRKRTNINKTQKNHSKENNYSERVSNVLQTIHNLPDQDEGLADFNPIPPPSSAGVENTKLRESANSSSMPYATEQPPELDSGMVDANQTTSNHQYSQQQYINQQKQYPSQFHSQSSQSRQYLPNNNSNYNSSLYNNSPYINGYDYGQSSTSNHGSNYDVMIEKLNYMINLLEEQKDERTNNVTEEVVLYSFLGIFIIFIVDSFARVGKYTR